MKRVSCNLCGAADLQPWFQMDCSPFYRSEKRVRETYTIARCGHCDLVQVLEIPSDEELADVYSKGYYHGRDEVGYKRYEAERRIGRIIGQTKQIPALVGRALRDPRKLRRVFEPQPLRRWPVNAIDKVAEIVQPPGTLLDVGCANGNFLIAAQKRGWTVRGIELSTYSSGCARDLGLDVFTGTLRGALENGYVQPSSSDVVTVWDTVEHVIDAMGFFRDCVTVLKPGGLLFLETLNIDSDRAQAEGKNWHFFRPPKHLIYYSEKTLKAFLECNGLQIIKGDNFRHDVVNLAARKGE